MGHLTSFTRGMIIPLESGIQPIVFQWNPYELHIDKNVKWGLLHVAGSEAPYFQYGCGEARRISISLEVSKDNNSDFFVKGYLDSILDLSKCSVKGMGVDRPPRVLLMLGVSLNVICVIDDIRVQFGSHKSRTHYAYLAEPVSLLPKEGNVTIVFSEDIHFGS